MLGQLTGKSYDFLHSYILATSMFSQEKKCNYAAGASIQQAASVFKATYTILNGLFFRAD
jgi:hypothetical protein